uniref:Expressed conserved protein n=1 Tax=Echinococcus granulosus TaxID=6210 RepID=A0A068X4K0_ECHGR|nr:hypothetical protein EgrG_002005300 [Echinococcus granulosus]
MAEDPAQRPEALQLVQMLDFIMRKVCIMNTSQLYIDFDSGGIPSVYQQAPTHPVDTNTVKQQDSSYYSLPEEMMTVQVSDPRSKVIPERRSPGDGQEPRRYVTTDATLFNRPSVSTLIIPSYFFRDYFICNFIWLTIQALRQEHVAYVLYSLLKSMDTAYRDGKDRLIDLTGVFWM